ncbi:MAG: hypothetical protein JXA67_20375 [Micromonosporaceae bacterium]|nr:hypothetical protein [Micromonosporaceae bacterium]
MTYSNVAAGAKIYASTINDLILYGPARPICMLQHVTTGQTINHNSNTTLTFGSGTEVFDDLDWHSTSSNTSRITPTIAGRYKITATVVWAATTTITACTVFVNKVGVGVDSSGNHKPNATNGVATFGGIVNTWADMNGSTDYLEMTVTQLSTGSVSQVTNVSSSGRTTFTVELMRAA